ncbi:MAG: hypothetical protein ACN4G0_04470, partial [Polyangiales bacterium]
DIQWEDHAMSITSTNCNQLTALALSNVLWLLCGCGNIDTFSLNPGHIGVDPDADPPSFAGAELQVSRFSTLCDRPASKALASKVGDGMEFSATDLGALEPPCAESPSPGVEIDLEGASLIFDFSSVAASGRFPATDFDGYRFHIEDERNDFVLVAAAVDDEASTVHVTNAEVSNEPNLIEVNFEGAAYDQHGFVKIDLWFAKLERGGAGVH